MTHTTSRLMYFFIEKVDFLRENRFEENDVCFTSLSSLLIARKYIVYGRWSQRNTLRLCNTRVTSRSISISLNQMIQSTCPDTQMNFRSLSSISQPFELIILDRITQFHGVLPFTTGIDRKSWFLI